MNYKNTIRSAFNLLHLDITKNLEYDRLTKAIMKKTIKSDSNCIDIGCHKGEILDIILKYSPKGSHFGFEPLPHLYNELKSKYNNVATILPFALADENGSSTFQYVKNAPAYSGIKKRKYDIDNPEIEEIEVEIKRLDEIIPKDLKIDFIKIDVEGAELGVLLGSEAILRKYKPTIIFEFGLGASDFYKTTPKDMFDLLTMETGLQIYLLKSFINNDKPLTYKEFDGFFNSNKEYYFIASSK